MISTVSRLVRSMLIALLGLACQQSASDIAQTGTAGAGGAAGTTETGCTPGAGGDQAFDQPPYLLYFSGFEAGRTVVGVRVDDRDVYWNLNGGRIMRGPKDGTGEPEQFFACGTCDIYNFAPDQGFVYFLNGAEVRRLDRDSGQELSLPLDLAHPAGGALMVDDTFVYTAMPGCAVLTRINKQTLAKETMKIDGVSFPGAGVTVLDKVGDQMVCASPSELFLVSEWGQAQSAYAGIDTLWAFAGAGEVGYWLEQPTANPPHVKLGRLAVLAGESGLVVQETQAGKTNRMVFASAIDRLLYGTISAIRAFDPQSESLGALVELSASAPEQLAGRPADLAVDDLAVYASVGGRVRRVVDGTETFPLAYWIAKVPLEQFR